MGQGPETAALPLIATMIGDPAGIGPEVCVKAIASGELEGLCTPVLIGDMGVLRRAAEVTGVTWTLQQIQSVDDRMAEKNIVRVIDPGGFDVSACPFGVSSAAAGQAVLNWMEIGTELGARGHIQGLVIGPIHSESLKLNGRITDIDALQPPGTFMLRMSGALRVVPLTEHLRLVSAVEKVTPQAVLALVVLLNETLIKWGLAQPRIAVAGINPHAMFPEDREQISPAIEQAQQRGIDVRGPISPDSVFRMALENKYDAVVTMYHDQGQIAVKTAAFEGACTVYLGLPYIMLNVPHGSAFDIAGTGTAQHKSVLAAMKTAAQLSSGDGIFA